MDYAPPKEAVIDALALAFGCKIANPHSMAKSVERPLEKLALDSYASSPGGFIGGNGGIKSLVSNGLKTAEFSGEIARLMRSAANSVFTSAATHRAYCSIAKVENFKPVEIDADIDAGLDSLSGRVIDGAEIEMVWATGKQTEAGKISTWARIFSFSRQLIINNDVSYLARIAKRIGSSSAGIEAKQVANALEATQTLADGKPAFGSSEGNEVTCQSLFIESSLALAIGTLRSQEVAPGIAANAAAKFLLVSPMNEVGAKHAMKELGLSEEITVSALAGIPDDRFYVLADPEQFPTISILNFETDQAPFLIEQKKVPIEYDGTQVKARLDTGAVLTSRLGIVRCKIQ